MPRGRTSRACQLISAGSSRMAEPLALKTAQRVRYVKTDLTVQRTTLAGLALDSATSSGLGRAPALQSRTPSRHHLELQDRRDYTPADRAARTCWSVVWTGKEEKEKWNDKKRVESREISLGFPGFVKSMFTKDSKPLRKRKRSLRYLAGA
ncbi:hypothetical protein TNCV_3037181 [Trichonephila clavipes]|nr:hypothetical protein TNCV_3037181 [Trichonephila clavipes]